MDINVPIDDVIASVLGYIYDQGDLKTQIEVEEIANQYDETQKLTAKQKNKLFKLYQKIT